MIDNLNSDYQKTNWIANETIVSADNLNNIENELEYVSGNLKVMNNNLDEHQNNELLHISIEERTQWNGKANQLDFDLHKSEDATNAHRAKNIEMANGFDVDTFINSFGLGYPNIPVSSMYNDDLDNLKTTGFYYANSPATNKPLGWNGYLFVFAHSRDFVFQKHTSLDGVVHQRTCFNGTWGAWENKDKASSVTMDNSDDLQTVITNLQTDVNEIGDKTLLQTTAKDTFVNAINETLSVANLAKTQANDGKTSIANAIGTPATSSDTFTILSSYLEQVRSNYYSRFGWGDPTEPLIRQSTVVVDDIRKNLANRLGEMGITISYTESMNTLINRVTDIPKGKKFARGTVQSSSVAKTYETTIGAFNFYDIAVEGLTFKPNYIIVTNASSELSVYNKSDSSYNQGAFVGGGGYNPGTLYKIAINKVDVHDTGFVLPVKYDSFYEWTAFE